MPHRTTVTFSDSAWRTLENICDATGKPMSEVLRDAIALKAWFTETRAQGGHVLIERDGNIREVISV